jgi:rRNA-processing protein FCF1
VLLDTNALLLPFRTGFPLEAEVGRACPGAPIVVPSSVLDELGRLAARGILEARGASALAERFPVLSVEGRGDAAVLDAAVRYHAWVVTADRMLAQRLRRRGVTVLVPRDRHRLETLRGRAVPPSPAPAHGPSKPTRRRQRL